MLTKFNTQNVTSSKILFFHIIGLSGLEEEPEVPEVKIHVSNVDGVRRHLRLLAPTPPRGLCCPVQGNTGRPGLHQQVCSNCYKYFCISKSAQIVLNVLVCAMNKPYNYSWLIQLVRIHVASEKVKLFIYQNCLPRKKNLQKSISVTPQQIKDIDSPFFGASAVQQALRCHLPILSLDSFR